MDLCIIHANPEPSVSNARTKSTVVIVIDPEAARHHQVAACLAPLRVVRTISLLDAFNLVEELLPGNVAIAASAADEPGFEMFLRLLAATGANHVIYGRNPPRGMPATAKWLQLSENESVNAIAEALGVRPSSPSSTPASMVATNPPELILIGASTGGITALEAVLSHFNADCPPTLIVQHMRMDFMAGFLDRLNRCCRPNILAAPDGAYPARGSVYFAATPGHNLVMTGRGQPRLSIVPAEANQLHTPSVDALFHSAAPYGSKVAAALLTGMGADGAAGLAKLRAAGSFTLAQDRESCVVYGMPRAAVEMGAATAVQPLDRIGPALLAGAVQDQFTRARRGTP